MPNYLEFDFSIGKWRGQFVWQGKGDYSELSSPFAFSSKEEAEDDACSVISDIFAATAEPLASNRSKAINATPSLAIVRRCGGIGIRQSAA